MLRECTAPGDLRDPVWETPFSKTATEGTGAPVFAAVNEFHATRDLPPFHPDGTEG